MCEKYVKIERIAEGACGVVYKARNTQTGQIVAIKKFKEFGLNEGIPSNCLREIQIIRSLENTKYVIKIIEVMMNESGNVYVIFDYHKSNLKSIIGLQKIDWKKIIYRMLEALAGLHQINVLHRDLKPQNVLIDENNDPLLADFGFSREFQRGEKMTNLVGTQYYRAPQLILGDMLYDSAVDVWSMGCIIYQIYSNKVLFEIGSELGILTKMFSLSAVITPPAYLQTLPRFQSFRTSIGLVLHNPNNHSDEFDSVPVQLRQVLRQMLDINPTTRISAQKALQSLRQ